jgi:uncharacterized protein YjbJ (UPF0337 family)
MSISFSTAGHLERRFRPSLTLHYNPPKTAFDFGPVFRSATAWTTATSAIAFLAQRLRATLIGSRNRPSEPNRGLKRSVAYRRAHRSPNMPIRTSVLSGALLLAIAAALGGCDSGDGGGQKTKGHIESAAGSLTGDRHLKDQGKKDEVVGGVKSTVGDLKSAVHDATH